MDTTQQPQKLSVSIGLLQSIRPKHKTRFSRSDAFVDLMCRVLGTTDNGNVNCTDTAIPEDANTSVLCHTNDNMSTESQKAVNNAAFGSHFERQCEQQMNESGKSSKDGGFDCYQQIQKPDCSAYKNVSEVSDRSSTFQRPDGIESLRQFDTNYSQLASFWKWNRETVHTFLKTLETEGLLLYEQTGKRLSIYIDI